MRFDLRADGDDATLLAFTLHYLPPGDTSMDHDVGGDRPGGLDTAWRPGFLVGFHEMLDQLDPYLRGEWTLADNRHELARFVPDGWSSHGLGFIEMYRQHVVGTIPPP
jgi:hypothetical protein